MDRMKESACEILDISHKIYQIEEDTNPNAIFKDKIFKTTEDGKIIVERDYERKDSSYYFETPEIRGVIIKRQNGNYCIKAMVKYIKTHHRSLWFAKIRIESSYDGDIQIMGNWGGSWQHPDYDDEDLMKKSNADLPIALDSMKNHLSQIYNELCHNNGLNSDLYDSEMTKRLKIYNN